MTAAHTTTPRRATLATRLLSQFHRPRGALGHVAAWILANRKSNRERNLWSVGLLEIAPHDRVLEIGCGPGVALHAISELTPRGFAAGVDHSATILAHARRRNARAIAAGRVQLVEAPLESLPTFDAPFDKVLAVNVLMFADDTEAVLRAIRERMRVGARIAITQQSRKPGATDADSVRAAEAFADALERSGFTNARVETLPLEPACAACVLAEAR